MFYYFQVQKEHGFKGYLTSTEFSMKETLTYNTQLRLHHQDQDCVVKQDLLQKLDAFHIHLEVVSKVQYIGQDLRKYLLKFICLQYLLIYSNISLSRHLFTYCNIYIYIFCLPIYL